mmetsp:Transcript_113249/g.259591  ORF Transcript_113249/g.259591 Transcript_113249/m.259591 type:complete len:201 (+) Transcript_113249:1231-1833(+)
MISLRIRCTSADCSAAFCWLSARWLCSDSASAFQTLTSVVEAPTCACCSDIALCASCSWQIVSSCACNRPCKFSFSSAKPRNSSFALPVLVSPTSASCCAASSSLDSVASARRCCCCNSVASTPQCCLSKACKCSTAAHALRSISCTSAASRIRPCDSATLLRSVSTSSNSEATAALSACSRFAASIPITWADRNASAPL